MKTNLFNSKLRTRSAFTLIELLVVIAIIGILAAMLVPALLEAQRRAAIAQCVNAQKQLVTAVILFTGDNDDQFVGMNDAGPEDWRIRPGQTYFVNNPPPVQPVPYAAAEAVQKFDNWGYRLGSLYPYAPNPGVIHCPGDIRYKRGILPAWSSYAGIHGLGQGSPSERLTKISQVRRPSDRAVFMEESDSRSVTYGGFTFGENLGTWAIRQGNAPPDPAKGISGNPNQTGYSIWGISSWYDAPAAFHGRSSSFSFLDGHAVDRRWVNPDTIRFANDPVWGRQNAASLIMGRDLNFIVLAYPSPLNP